MERRDFLRTLSGAGLLSILDPAYLAAKEALLSWFSVNWNFCGVELATG